MQYSRILLQITVVLLMLLCFSCREPIGEQHGAPSKDSVPYQDKINAPVPKQKAPQKTKQEKKSKPKDTLSPKIAILHYS